MKGGYLAALIAVTMSIASHVLVLGTLGPIAPAFVTGLRQRLRGCCRLIAGFIHRWIAVVLARRQYQIETFAQRDLANRQLTSIPQDQSGAVR
jgi:hypothetical protein